MAASTAGQIVLKNMSTGKVRSEAFTMTPTANQYVTWTSNGATLLRIDEGNEKLLDLQFNNDGVTTVTQAKFVLGGQDIRNRYLMVLYAADSTMPTRIIDGPTFSGGKDLQLQVLA